jgi:hypothetical protein
VRQITVRAQCDIGHIPQPSQCDYPSDPRGMVPPIHKAAPSGHQMRLFDIPFVRFLILLAVVVAGIYWLYATAPPQQQVTANPWQRYPEYNSEIRYCFAEEIRLGAAGFVLKQGAASADIERFNGMIDAYNQRCGKKTYTNRHNFAVVEAIRSEVQANRNALWAEGIARFPGIATNNSLPKAAD